MYVNEEYEYFAKSKLTLLLFRKVSIFLISFKKALEA